MSMEEVKPEPVAFIEATYADGQTKAHSMTLHWIDSWTGETGPFDAGMWGKTHAHLLVRMDEVEAYAQSLVAKERERCARICDEIERQQEIDGGAANTGCAAACASAIRSGTKE
jgi:hypothetical protein